MPATPALTRRAFTAVVGTSLLAPLARAAAPAKAPEPAAAAAPAAPAGPAPKALPFDPAKLKGLSEKLITSHHDKNYVAAVKGLGKVEQELAATTKDTPPFMVSALRDKELLFRNSKFLHESYFDALGGDGKRSGALVSALAKDFGSEARWEELFRAAGMGLAGGSGWVVLSAPLEGGPLRIAAGANHKEGLAGGVPLLAMDLYEHAFQMDYGADAARYLEAYFANLKWEVVEARYAHAQAAQALFAAR
jgi:Fe-Mn family superoxide dismutase